MDTTEGFGPTYYRPEVTRETNSTELIWLSLIKERQDCDKCGSQSTTTKRFKIHTNSELSTNIIPFVLNIPKQEIGYK